jgi:hypothetical protein
MKLQAEVGDKSIRSNSPATQAVSAVIDGLSYNVGVSEARANVYLIKKDGKVFGHMLHRQIDSTNRRR